MRSARRLPVHRSPRAVSSPRLRRARPAAPHSPRPPIPGTTHGARGQAVNTYVIYLVLDPQGLFRVYAGAPPAGLGRAVVMEVRGAAAPPLPGEPMTVREML